MRQLEPHIVTADVPGVGPVAFYRPRLGKPGDWRYGLVQPRTLGGSELSGDDENAARDFWREHPELR